MSEYEEIEKALRSDELGLDEKIWCVQRLIAAAVRDTHPPLDELAAVLRGKDEMGEKLARALGVPAGPLSRLVDEAIARIAAAEERGRRRGVEEAAQECELRIASWERLRDQPTVAARVDEAESLAEIIRCLAPCDSGKVSCADPALQTFLRGRSRK